MVSKPAPFLSLSRGTSAFPECYAKKSKLIAFVAFLFVLAIVLRLVPHGYNVAAVGALGMFVGCYWSLGLGILISIAAMSVSDLVGHWMGVPSMGAYSVWLMATVYAATGVSAVVGKLISTVRNQIPGSLWLGVPAGAVLSGAAFFLITNFACWFDPMLGYPRTMEGLMNCYVAAIPFAKGTFIGNLVYSCLFFGIYQAMTASQTTKATADA
ncbi:MAG: DUF6580 family putative transport protein [Planctomycetota bacterium]